MTDRDSLAEAAGALVDEWDAAVAGDMPLNGHYQKQALERLRAALRAAESPTPEHPNGGCHKHPFGGTPERYACGHFCYEPPCLEVLEKEEATPGWPPQDS